ncbi:MAG: PepSY-associated TM helix domain-containing protein [Chitinophagaceae bacterium]
MKRFKKPRWAVHQRRWFGKWHLYLGILAGAILCVVGLTGSILVFQDEIDAALNKDLFRVMQSQKKYTLEEIIPLVKAKHPELVFDYASYVDRHNPNASYRFYDFVAEKEFFINPYNVQVCGKRLSNSAFVRTVMNIHISLLVPKVGQYIVGLASLCMLILTISGLRLWVPQQYKKWKQWRSVLTVNFKASLKRQNYDWHNVLGFYSAPVVIMLALTGFAITFSTVFIGFLFMLTGHSPQSTSAIFGMTSDTTQNVRSITVTEASQFAEKAVPYADIEGIALPANKVGVFRFDMRAPGASKDGKRIMLMVDQYSGKVKLNSEKDFPNIGHSYLSWLVPIHYGTYGGMPTRILALIGGLIPLLLFITGFIIWWPRLKKQQKSDTQKVRTKTLENPIQSWAAAFKSAFRKGLKYALMFLPCAFLCGALYGLISGVVLQPAVFGVLYVGICIIVNFIVAMLCGIFSLLFLRPFGKGRLVLQYWAYSLAFGLVFIPVTILIANSGWKIF